VELLWYGVVLAYTVGAAMYCGLGGLEESSRFQPSAVRAVVRSLAGRTERHQPLNEPCRSLRRFLHTSQVAMDWVQWLQCDQSQFSMALYTLEKVIKFMRYSAGQAFHRLKRSFVEQSVLLASGVWGHLYRTAPTEPVPSCISGITQPIPL